MSRKKETPVGAGVTSLPGFSSLGKTVAFYPSPVNTQDGSPAHAVAERPRMRGAPDDQEKGENCFSIYSHIQTPILWKVGKRGSQSVAPAPLMTFKAPPGLLTTEPFIKRGKIEGASRKSMASLRGELVNIHALFPYAFTGTIPGDIIDGPAWRKLWDNYQHKLSRFGYLALWRVELQQRKQPHVHAIIWRQTDTTPDHDRDISDLKMAWWSCIDALGPYRYTDDWDRRHALSSRMSMFGAYEHSCDVQAESRDTRAGWWRYMAAHATKSKQAQGGWLGRQWGFIGRARAVPAALEEYSLTKREHCWILRRIRRLMRLRRAFGLRGKTSWLVRPDTMRALIAMAIEHRR